MKYSTKSLSAKQMQDQFEAIEAGVVAGRQLAQEALEAGLSLEAVSFECPYAELVSGLHAREYARAAQRAASKLFALAGK